MHFLQTFQFNVDVSRLPRFAKLCLAVHSGSSKQLPLFWVNTNVFDYKSKMKGTLTLHMWPYTQACAPTFHNLSPLRQSMSNPDMGEASSVMLSFHLESVPSEQRASPSHNIEFPVAIADKASGGNNGTNNNVDKFFTEELQKIADRDPLHDLTEQEKDLIWKIREYCLTRLPDLLPRIIDCVDYTNQEDVLELNGLLSRWPVLPAERALQLLDYAYPDEHVRRFAVKCLRESSDDVILRYLLQLAQALKHESFFRCDLVEFLLERALNNQHIGHCLFWELRAEMNVVGIHYGLLLEAYLSAAPEHLTILMHSNTLLERCRAIRATLEPNIRLVSGGRSLSRKDD